MKYMDILISIRNKHIYADHTTLLMYHVSELCHFWINADLECNQKIYQASVQIAIHSTHQSWHLTQTSQTIMPLQRTLDIDFWRISWWLSRAQPRKAVRSNDVSVKLASDLLLAFICWILGTSRNTSTLPWSSQINHSSQSGHIWTTEQACGIVSRRDVVVERPWLVYHSYCWNSSENPQWPCPNLCSWPGIRTWPCQCKRSTSGRSTTLRWFMVVECCWCGSWFPMLTYQEWPYMTSHAQSQWLSLKSLVSK